MTKVSHIKGPEKEGLREQTHYPTRIEYIEGLDDVSIGEGNSSITDYAIEIATIAKTKAENAESIAAAAKTIAEEARNATSNGFAITDTEPDNGAYWLHIEEVEDE